MFAQRQQDLVFLVYRDISASARDNGSLLEPVQFKDRGIGGTLGLYKRVGKAVKKALACCIVCPDFQTFAHVENDHAQIVQPMDVVCVSMGVYYPVQLPNTGIQQLHTKIWARVDKNPCAPIW